jgi:hypothetical protein
MSLGTTRANCLTGEEHTGAVICGGGGVRSSASAETPGFATSWRMPQTFFKSCTHPWPSAIIESQSHAGSCSAIEVGGPATLTVIDTNSRFHSISASMCRSDPNQNQNQNQKSKSETKTETKTET